jgi:hypothetical protein
MPDLVALSKKDLLTCFIRIYVLDHSVGVEVDELDWKRLKCVSFRDVVLDSLLKLLLGESLAPNSLKFVVCNCRR